MSEVKIIATYYANAQKSTYHKKIKKLKEKMDKKAIDYQELGQELIIAEKDVPRVLNARVIAPVKYGKTIKELLQERGLSFSTYNTRMQRGCTLDEALTRGSLRGKR